MRHTRADSSQPHPPSSKSGREQKKRGGCTKQFPLYMCTTTTTLILFEFYFRCVSEEQAREETNPIIVWRSRQPNGPVLVYLHKSHPEERARMMREDVDCCVCVCVCVLLAVFGWVVVVGLPAHTHTELNPISNQADRSTLKKMERLCRPSRRRAPRTHTGEEGG